MNTNRQISILTWPALLVFVTVFCAIHLSAETDSLGIDFEDYKGLWLTEINDEAVYLLIKKNHIARYFYKDRIDNNVYKGQWKLDEENTLLLSSFDFNDLRFRLDSGDSVSANFPKGDTSISILTKVPEDILGEWARPPDYEAPKNTYMPSTYFGLWKMQDKESPRIIKIWNNRTVISKSKEEVSSPHDLLQGEWYKHGQQLHIAWEDGSYSIIDNRNENRVKLFDFAPGSVINEEVADYKLIKQSPSDFDESDWSKNQQILAQQNNISLSQFNYKSLLKFYRGEWITLDETQPNAVEIMKFNRFGGVNLASDSKIKGSWYLSGRGCLINLEDGIRMRLKYIGSAFLVFVYEANRPLDGFPNKILKAAPKNSQKLNLLNAEVSFTLKLLEQINLINAQGQQTMPLVSNWSNRDTINPSPSSPWWWPIWSDNPKIQESEPFSRNNLSPSLTNDADSIGSSTEAKQTNLPNPIDEINKSKWEWPF